MIRYKDKDDVLRFLDNRHEDCDICDCDIRCALSDYSAGNIGFGDLLEIADDYDDSWREEFQDWLVERLPEHYDLIGLPDED